jgi:hypothetical protein
VCVCVCVRVCVYVCVCVCVLGEVRGTTIFWFASPIFCGATNINETATNRVFKFVLCSIFIYIH